jgi:hypothetical protein
MHLLVLPNQSAFIHGRAIHDNFRVVQSVAKLLHARRRACVLLKIDIAKALTHGIRNLTTCNPIDKMRNRLQNVSMTLGWFFCLLLIKVFKVDVLKGL